MQINEQTSSSQELSQGAGAGDSKQNFIEDLQRINDNWGRNEQMRYPCKTFTIFQDNNNTTSIAGSKS